MTTPTNSGFPRSNEARFRARLLAMTVRLANRFYDFQRGFLRKQEKKHAPVLAGSGGTSANARYIAEANAAFDETLSIYQALLETLMANLTSSLETSKAAAFNALDKSIAAGDVPSEAKETIKKGIERVHSPQAALKVMDTLSQPTPPSLADLKLAAAHPAFHPRIETCHKEACDHHTAGRQEDYMRAIARTIAYKRYAKQFHKDNVNHETATACANSDFMHKDTHRFANTVTTTMLVTFKAFAVQTNKQRPKQQDLTALTPVILQTLFGSGLAQRGRDDEEARLQQGFKRALPAVEAK
ncbi:MAG: hypothetical protein COB66_07415 [Coxiella sp. (in: Bacteria)]|nr:MAG: hypothetical protein COB66_07415 [Coxiella sp. (in: g-proteobacteria)]